MARIVIYIILSTVWVACGNDKKLSEKRLAIQIEKPNSESHGSSSLKAIPTKKKNRINSCISR